VRTDMLLGKGGDRQSFLLDGSVSTEEVAEAVLQTMRAETFFVLPHPEVLDYLRRKRKETA
jgi:hypothetical protein